MRSVAIIGGGPSGLASAKAALEWGLRPVVFEREHTIGGIWRPGDGAAWPAMSTNLSRFTCAFSDHPWPEGTPDFPAQPEVSGYLTGYAQAFGLDSRIRTGAVVTRLERSGGRFTVHWRGESASPGRRRAEPFDAVIVASGFFSRPFTPGPRGPVQALHSSRYRGPAGMAGARVTVAGMAFSGAEIAAELAAAGARVTAIVARPMWLLPRLPASGVPLDLVLYRRSSRPRGESGSGRNRFLDGLGGNPGRLDPRLRIDPASDERHHALICQPLDEHVASGRLAVEPGRVRAIDGPAVVLDNGVRVPSEVVVWCTGYRLALPFLGRRELALLGFDAADPLQPLLMHRCTFHPDLPGIAFVGVYRGPFFAVIELQARWACAVLSGALPPPDRLSMLAGIDEERQIRTARPRPQFPHADYVDLADGLAREIGALPDVADLLDAPVVPAQYRLRGPFSKPALAREEIARALRRANR